jgi:1-acyl-sn-glycerol-3-phosphate acyltransferase
MRHSLADFPESRAEKSVIQWDHEIHEGERDEDRRPQRRTPRPVSWQTKSAAPPPGYRYGPPYRPSWETLVRGIVHIARGRRRSLGRDAAYAVANMPCPPLVRGADLVPEDGRFTIVANHYERPGLWMAWPALALCHVIWERTGKDLHWVAIEEWESFSLFGVPVPSDAIRRVFQRAFNTYGIIAMPPPTAPMAARASAMRVTARQVREGEIVGIMPEGDVGPTPELLPAREGVGAFLHMLELAGGRMLPVGIFEENDRLVLRMGDPYSLDVPRGMPREEADRYVRDRVMTTIRDLLPPPLQGAYRDRSVGAPK